ncbi:TetR/AcrR family transcriptional regulator [Actinacidiphila yeochonensis]|uniref:TetR/AcrR family transcriptional regulator n=1 Tax=Actinacidiphila yeochonensis TaxID=89050 RepID=UPI0006923A00|nr:TetR/AcrR family transcriptional regulator [Actinacidiphila yeochonensis]
MATPHHARRSDTRRRIQDVALRLFAEQGYEKTSLREIAERLDVTKAALYYHFRTKEDILVSLCEDVTAPVDALITWARAQPHSLETKQEVLRRYSEALWDSEDFFRFVHENQATVRDLAVGAAFRSRVKAVNELLREPDAPVTAQVRSVTALMAMHAGMFVTQNVEGDPEEKRSAVLDVALDLVTQAHRETALTGGRSAGEAVLTAE